MPLPQHNPVEPPWYVTRMPGGVGGVAPRGVPLSRSMARLGQSAGTERQLSAKKGMAATPAEERLLWGHEEQFPLLKPSGRYGFREGTFAGTRGKEPTRRLRMLAEGGCVDDSKPYSGRST
jgi:hypothetical protein